MYQYTHLVFSFIHGFLLMSESQMHNGATHQATQKRATLLKKGSLQSLDSTVARSSMLNPSRVHQDLRNHAFFIRIDLVMMWVKFAEEEGLFQYLNRLPEMENMYSYALMHMQMYVCI